jgi:hypothetical protein
LRLDGDADALLQSAILVAFYYLVCFGQQVIVTGGTNIPVTEVRHGSEFRQTNDAY